MTKRDPFKYFKTSPEIIRLAVMLYVRFPLSLRNVEDRLHERGIDVSHEAVRYFWLRFVLGIPSRPVLHSRHLVSVSGRSFSKEPFEYDCHKLPQ
jgi:hypothetical protein